MNVCVCACVHVCARTNKNKQIVYSHSNSDIHATTYPPTNTHIETHTLFVQSETALSRFLSNRLIPVIFKANTLTMTELVLNLMNDASFTLRNSSDSGDSRARESFHSRLLEHVNCLKHMRLREKPTGAHAFSSTHTHHTMRTCACLCVLSMCL